MLISIFGIIFFFLFVCFLFVENADQTKWLKNKINVESEKYNICLKNVVESSRKWKYLLWVKVLSYIYITHVVNCVGTERDVHSTLMCDSAAVCSVLLFDLNYFMQQY